MVVRMYWNMTHSSRGIDQLSMDNHNIVDQLQFCWRVEWHRYSCTYRSRIDIVLLSTGSHKIVDLIQYDLQKEVHMYQSMNHSSRDIG